MSVSHFSAGAVTPIPFLGSQRLVISSLSDEKVGRVRHNVFSNSCIPALASGLAGSLATKHPFPFFVGLSACFPRALAQKKVGGQFQVNTYTPGNQGGPSVSSLSNGDFVVAWTDTSGEDGNGWGIFGQIFNALGAKVGSEFQVNRYTIGNQVYASVSPLSNGDFVVAWEDDSSHDGNLTGVFGQIFNPTGGKVGSEFLVNTYTTGNQVKPSASTLSNGDFVVVWEDDSGLDGNSTGVFGQIFNPTGAKVGSEFQVNTYTPGNQGNPSVSSLSNGDFLVAWEDDSGLDGNGWGVFGQIFNVSGAKVGSEFQVNTYTPGNQGNPSVSTLSNGDFVVAWYDDSGHDGNGVGVFSQIFNATGGKVGSEFQANTYTPGNQGNPSVSSLSNGDFVVAWEDDSGHDGNSWGIFGQIFNALGAKVGSQFQVNTYTVGSQRLPSVSSLSNRDFVVAWEDGNGHDGSGAGVFGQIFNESAVSSTSTSMTSLSLTTGPLSQGISISSGPVITTVSTTALSLTTGSMSQGTSTSTGTIPTTSGSTIFAGTTVSSSSTTIVQSVSSTGSVVKSSSGGSNTISWLGPVVGAAGGVTCLAIGGFLLYQQYSKGNKKELTSASLGSDEELGSVKVANTKKKHSVVDMNSEQKYGSVANVDYEAKYGDVADIDPEAKYGDVADIDYEAKYGDIANIDHEAKYGDVAGLAL